MAERQEERNIQRIVAAVISNLHSVSSLSEASSSSGNSSNRFGSREEEIRNAFSIPRDAASPATVENGVDGNEASSSSQNTPVAGSSSFQCASFPSTSRPIPLSTNYSHLRNYSQGKGKIRKGKQAARSTSTGRFEKGPGSGGQGKQCEPTFKDVCLLPSPNWGTVPRLKAKANLIEKGLYIDAWSFQKTYQETQLRAAISSLFHERLVDNHGNEVG